MYKLHYITLYYKLNYGPFLDSLIKTWFASVNSNDHQHIYLLWHQMFVLSLSELETLTVEYIWFHMGPLRYILLLCVSYKIRMNIGLFIPFIPNLVDSGDQVQIEL